MHRLHPLCVQKVKLMYLRGEDNYL
ncbi:hypothetical protein KSF78_0008311 [Schistosoma japonicum]|nr:hypothetical protein KSF78_0008311 [Schistosoma japonicum]